MHVEKETLQQMLSGIERDVLLNTESALYYKALLEQCNGNVGEAKKLIDKEYSANGKRYKEYLNREHDIQSQIITLFYREVLALRAIFEKAKGTLN